MLYPVILSGGVGTRLWPVSRSNLPKQFVKAFDRKSLFQKTMARISDTKKFQAPRILTNISQRYLTEAQLKENNIDKATIFLEPMQKGTAPAIMLAALEIYEKDKNAAMLVLSSDNEIINERSFKNILLTAGEVALKHNKLLLFSSKPTYPETGYGYILPGKIINKGEKGVKVYDISHFKEKPSTLEVEACIKSGYQWNSGIFVFPVKLFVEEMKIHSPYIYEYVSQAYKKAKAIKEGNHKWLFIDEEGYNESPEDSIDYALVEKTSNLSVIKMNIGWHDVGSWKTIYEIANKDQDGNVIKGNVIAIGSRNSYIMSNDDSKVLAAVDIENLTVVQTADATIILPRHKSQDVRKVTAMLKERKQGHFLVDPRTFKSWGYYEVIKHEKNIVLKKIVYYGKCSNLSKGSKSAKHFIVNKGKIKVIWGSKNVTLKKHDSLFLPPKVDYEIVNLSKFESHVVKMEARVSKKEGLLQ